MTIDLHRLQTPWRAAPLVAFGLAACSGPDPDVSSGVSGVAPGVAISVGALDGAPRTIPYGGYVDFDGEPVNAGSIGFNFVLFPCATPGTGAGGCAPLWVAKGTWTATADWLVGWPTGAQDEVDLPIFSGRFTVELGAAGQNPLPEGAFDAGGEPLYLGVRVAGRALAGLQKIVPSARTHIAALAERARVADNVGDLGHEELATRRVWATSGEVAPGERLELATRGDASDAEVLLWERRGQEWIAIAPDAGFLGDPALHAYYPFDEASGNIAHDASGRGHDLTISETFSLGEPGVVGTGLRFGGSGASGGGVASTASLGMPFSSGLTFALWVNSSELDRDIHFFTLHRDGSGHDAYLSFYPPACGSNQLAFRSNSETRCGTTLLQLNGVWTHIAAVYNPATNQVRFYVDGEPDGVGSSLNLPGLTTTTIMNYLALGRRFGGHGYDFIGRMDEAVVFNRMLAREEITRLYRHGVRSGYALTRGADGRVSVENQSGATRDLRLLVVKSPD